MTSTTTKTDILSPSRTTASGELEYPETVFVRDIENRVFQTIVLEVLSKVDGIGLLEGNLFDSLLGRNPSESVKGIYAEQDDKSHSVGIKVEVNIKYGVSIPEKAEEIQAKIAEETTKLTGLHVSYVHVVFKGIVPTGHKPLEVTVTPAVSQTQDYTEELD